MLAAVCGVCTPTASVVVVVSQVIQKRGKSKQDIRALRQEIDILRSLTHQHIIRLFDAFETRKDFVVVMEYAQADLYQVLEDDGTLPLQEVQALAGQLVSALHYLHSHRIIHRDMKPQNILLTGDGKVKLCDFGFARALSAATVMVTSIKGTPLYMAPEVVQHKPYDHRADLWSLGVILYELFVGEPPFYTDSIGTLVDMILKQRVKWPRNMPPQFKSFLQCLLLKDPAQRMAWPDLLSHPFIAQSVPGGSGELGAIEWGSPAAFAHAHAIWFEQQGVSASQPPVPMRAFDVPKEVWAGMQANVRVLGCPLFSPAGGRESSASSGSDAVERRSGSPCGSVQGTADVPASASPGRACASATGAGQPPTRHSNVGSLASTAGSIDSVVARMMHETDVRSSGFAPEEMTVTAAQVSAAAQAGKWGEVLDMLQESPRAGTDCQPLWDAFAAMMGGTPGVVADHSQHSLLVRCVRCAAANQDLLQPDSPLSASAIDDMLLWLADMSTAVGVHVTQGKEAGAGAPAVHLARDVWAVLACIALQAAPSTARGASVWRLFHAGPEASKEHCQALRRAAADLPALMTATSEVLRGSAGRLDLVPVVWGVSLMLAHHSPVPLQLPACAEALGSVPAYARLGALAASQTCPREVLGLACLVDAGVGGEAVKQAAGVLLADALARQPAAAASPPPLPALGAGELPWTVAALCGAGPAQPAALPCSLAGRIAAASKGHLQPEREAPAVFGWLAGAKGQDTPETGYCALAQSGLPPAWSLCMPRLLEPALQTFAAAAKESPRRWVGALAPECLGAWHELLGHPTASVATAAVRCLGHILRAGPETYAALDRPAAAGRTLLQDVAALMESPHAPAQLWASYTFGNALYHSDALFDAVAPLLHSCLPCLEAATPRVRANACGVLANAMLHSERLLDTIASSTMLDAAALIALYDAEPDVSATAWLVLHRAAKSATGAACLRKLSCAEALRDVAKGRADTSKHHASVLQAMAED